MTMLYEKKVSIWSKVREDRDIDDLIFESEMNTCDSDNTTSDR
jgi:hypothetical protein